MVVDSPSPSRRRRPSDPTDEMNYFEINMIKTKRSRLISTEILKLKIEIIDLLNLPITTELE